MNTGEWSPLLLDAHAKAFRVAAELDGVSLQMATRAAQARDRSRAEFERKKQQ
jgi:hypothetical protein